MLLRLKVKGFKNLRDVDIRFGPFTCIAGANAVGKSNVFDALVFLRDLASYPIAEAATRVRNPDGRSADLRELFSKSGDRNTGSMSFEAEFISPEKVVDDFGQEATSSTTLLRYRLELALSQSGTKRNTIVLTHEELVPLAVSRASEFLKFDTSKEFRASVAKSVRRSPQPFIRTERLDDTDVVVIRTDGHGGKPQHVPARKSPRTIVGGTNTTGYPTILSAKREMQSWISLQFEPSALRESDALNAEPHVSDKGAHLPATLQSFEPDVRTDIANQVAKLIPDLRELEVEADVERNLLTLKVLTLNGSAHPARALSDGTLRFIALSTMGADPQGGNLICLEEPENGIHPLRIPLMVELLKSLCVDPRQRVSKENLLRQVIINTHSPRVVDLVGEGDLIVAREARHQSGNQLIFETLPGTWRGDSHPPLSWGAVSAYLGERTKKKATASVGGALQRQMNLWGNN